MGLEQKTAQNISCKNTYSDTNETSISLAFLLRSVAHLKMFL